MEDSGRVCREYNGPPCGSETRTDSGNGITVGEGGVNSAISSPLPASSSGIGIGCVCVCVCVRGCASDTEKGTSSLSTCMGVGEDSCWGDRLDGPASTSTSMHKQKTVHCWLLGWMSTQIHTFITHRPI